MIFGFMVYAVFLTYYLGFVTHGTGIIIDIPWIVLGFGLSMFGAELPDYDQLADRLLNHRDVITHSALIPVMLYIVVALFSPHITIAPLLFLVLLGHASHMFLDLFPVWQGSGKMLQGKKNYGGLQAPALWLVEGVTGEEIYKKLQGTYLIHLPVKIPDLEAGKKQKKGAKPKERRTFEKGRTRIWLTLSGLIDLGLGLLAYNAFMPFLPFPT
jgi:hypothetical protein